MEDVKLTLLEDQRGWIDHVRTWLPRVAVALLFFFVGKSKFGANSSWIKTFEQIGFGQWFRYVTGVIQMLGAIAVLIPRIFPWGIVILACTMLGAILAWIFLLGVPFNAIFPAALLIGLLIIGGEDLLNLFRVRTPPAC
ncbi:MAG TPA: DoxX family protein [Pyrinomonadaceae bacterium]|nr:DoxX family protein [Pyrinomonadaceae bacterium]